MAITAIGDGPLTPREAAPICQFCGVVGGCAGATDGRCIKGGSPTPTRHTDAPNQLVDFIDRVKRLGLRNYKGEFVASDGTHIPCEFAFERTDKARKADDGD